MITIDDIIYKIHDVPGISRLPFMSRFIQNEEGEEEEKEEFKLQGKFYVLLVDDQKEDLEAMKSYFEEAGAIVSVAENGVSALWLARKDKFNIILIANTMRQMDGLQVYKNLTNSPDNKNRDTAVYLMLRRRDPRTPEDFKEYGFQEVLTKPIGRNTILDILINRATKTMLPDNTDMLVRIKDDSVKERLLSEAGIDFSEALENCKGELLTFYAHVIKFIKLSEEIKDRIYDELLDGDVNKYMVDARTMRDLSLSIGAERLYDFFDDHVNMARDDVLEIAAKNYPSLEREWDFIYDCLIRFTNKIGVDTSVLYASTQQ